MNPPGVFVEGVRQREYSSTNDPLPLSGKLIPEFFGRRNIRDMFTRKPSLEQSPSVRNTNVQIDGDDSKLVPKDVPGASVGEPDVEPSASSPSPRRSVISTPTGGKKRVIAEASAHKNGKRSKSGSVASAAQKQSKGQQSLKGFFKSKAASPVHVDHAAQQQEDLNANERDEEFSQASQSTLTLLEPGDSANNDGEANSKANLAMGSTNGTSAIQTDNSQFTSASPVTASFTSAHEEVTVHDPIETKETWSRLFTKPAAPRCEGHEEPCITLLTKKPGMNLGRSFWMCPRPLGPSGAKERNTQWRCQTFIWCSDWNPNSSA